MRFLAVFSFGILLVGVFIGSAAWQELFRTGKQAEALAVLAIGMEILGVWGLLSGQISNLKK